MKQTNQRVHDPADDVLAFILKALLFFVFICCVAWAASTDGMVALIPVILAIVIGISLVGFCTDYIKNL